MNREIKFKIWDTVNKDFKNGAIYSIYEDAGLNLDEGEGKQYVFLQFTGTQDKNGKEIYEGDVVETAIIVNYGYAGRHSHFKKVEIVFIDGCFRFKDFPYVDFFDSVRNNSIEILGNVFENPELLKNYET